MKKVLLSPGVEQAFGMGFIVLGGTMGKAEGSSLWFILFVVVGVCLGLHALVWRSLKKGENFFG